MKATDLLSKIESILESKKTDVKKRVIKEDGELTQDQMSTPDTEASVDFDSEVPEGEEVETLVSYVAGIEEMLTPEQKEAVKSFIQSKIEGSSDEEGLGGEENLEGPEGDEEIEFTGEV